MYDVIDKKTYHGGEGMNKDKILEKSRIDNKNNDEGNMHIINNAFRYGSRIYLLFTVLLTGYVTIKWNIADGYLLMTLLWGYLAGTQTGYCKATGEKRTVLITIMWCVSLVMLAFYVSMTW